MSEVSKASLSWKELGLISRGEEVKLVSRSKHWIPRRDGGKSGYFGQLVATRFPFLCYPIIDYSSHSAKDNKLSTCFPWAEGAKSGSEPKRGTKRGSEFTRRRVEIRKRRLKVQSCACPRGQKERGEKFPQESRGLLSHRQANQWFMASFQPIRVAAIFPLGPQIERFQLQV